MLLGIVLHAALSFAPIPWTVRDSQQNEFYYVLFACIHGFRMPLFFMLSGFFTAMLWRKRGLASSVCSGKRDDALVVLLQLTRKELLHIGAAGLAITSIAKFGRYPQGL